MATEIGGGEGVSGNVGELVTALEQATAMAKQLPITTDSAHIHHIYSSLHAASLSLSSFLFSLQVPLPPPTPFPTCAAENSVSSAVGGNVDVDDEEDSPMQVVSYDGEQNSRKAMEEVEERMRHGLFIRNKRPKRSLSPSDADRDHHACDHGFRATAEYDAQRARERALDLVLQFHG